MVIVWIGLGAAVLYAIQLYVYVKWWNKDLDVTLDFQEESVFQGEESALLEVIENRKFLPLPIIKVKFTTSRYLQFLDMDNSKISDFYYRHDMMSILMFQKVTKRLAFKASKRGYYRIRSLDVLGSDIFLSREEGIEQRCQTYLYVYPARWNQNEVPIALQQITGEILSKRHLQEDPFEYRGLREYHPIDDMRVINWKATARTSGLKVNMKNFTAMEAIRIIMDVEDSAIIKHAELLEKTLQIGAALSENFLASGMRVSILTNGYDIEENNPVSVLPGAGKKHLEYILKAIARVDLDKPVPQLKESCLGNMLENPNREFTVFISHNSNDDIQEALEKMLEKKQDIYWIFPCKADTQIQPRISLRSRFYPVWVDDRL